MKKIKKEKKFNLDNLIKKSRSDKKKYILAKLLVISVLKIEYEKMN